MTADRTPHPHLPIFKALQYSYPPPVSCPDGLDNGPPSYVGVGTMRSGTTWWHDLIIRHPEVYSPTFLREHKIPVKERHFFDRFCNVPFSDADVDDYAHWFPRPAGKLVGEYTPSYLVDHWVPPLLALAAPDARVLVMLRDPIDRYVSGLRFQFQQGDPRTPPELAREQTVRSLYWIQLHGLLRSFPRAQVLILQFERCRAAPAQELARTYRFLGIDDSFVPTDLTEPRNTSAPERYTLEPAQREQLAELFADSTRRLAADFPEIDLSLWPSAKM